MINILALSLVIATLVGAGVWSPPSDPHHLVREGSRVIVVEYERQVDDDHSSSSPHQLIQEAKDKFKEASSLLPNLGQGLSTPSEIQSSTTDLDNNALSATKSAVEDTKEAVESLVHKGKEKVEQTKNTLKNTAENAMHEGKKRMEEKAGNFIHKAETKMIEETKNVGEEMKKDAIEIVRRSKRLVCNVCSYVVTPETVKKVAKVVHLFGFSMAYGAGVWVTFVSSYLLSRALPRQQFAVVQSRIYPVYFRVVAGDVVVVLIAHLVENGWKNRVERLQGCCLFVVLVLVLVNMLFFEPKATKVMLERMKMEREEGRGRDIDDTVSEPILTSSPPTAATTRLSPGVVRTEEVMKSRMTYLTKRLKKLNTYSSLLNVIGLMVLTFHLVHLASHEHLTC
ncbi:FAD-binding type PCMH subdomain 1-containing protein [Dioscorea alata]|uniref:FAD-binding type PCMH subdomain 1-containing protein n=1 Tax=Dioscorea alata TaxID=55571 RepID=A0ACB7VBI6_DIOAL|nr:FAD-binding type PCMH subdomain 1-containing protein [Dioscorea alata]